MVISPGPGNCAAPNLRLDLSLADRVELVVLRDKCEETITIDLNLGTVVDMAFPDAVIELKNPIVVPPCDSAP